MVYLLTFSCYGHRLPGDERGSVDRTRGEQRGGLIAPSKALLEHASRRFRGWELLAAHVRTTHVHAVTDLPCEPGNALRDFKTYSSRALNRTQGACTRWSRGGSTRRLLTPEAIRAAIKYVADRQGSQMALFVAEQ